MGFRGKRAISLVEGRLRGGTEGLEMRNPAIFIAGLRGQALY